MLALARLSAQRALLAFDFDGTLAPIVAHPADARIPADLVQRMRRLVRRHPVAIVTGRDADDVRSRLGFTPSAIVGNHGADLGASGPMVDAPLLALDATIAADRARMDSLGVGIERKRHSIAFHLRHAPDPVAAERFVRTLLRRCDARLQVFGGKFVVNAMAEGAMDKAGAVRHLMARFATRAALYVGDDVNDEVVFNARIAGVVSVHMAPPRPSAAHFVLDEVRDLVKVADLLLGDSRPD